MSDFFIRLTGVDGKRVLIRLGEIVHVVDSESTANSKRTTVTIRNDMAFWVKETADEIAEMIANDQLTHH